MANPIRQLPVLQNWDCHSCSDCCRIEAVVTDAEKQRIEALGLVGDEEVAPGPWFSCASSGLGKWRLKQRPEGGCVFLTKSNHCRLQERFGPDVKPFVCRLFPFVLVPAGNHWRVGMRFSCPSVATNAGRPVADAEPELTQLARLLERHVGRSAESAPAPILFGTQQMPWVDVARLVEVLVEIVEDRTHRLERRLRICLALSRVCLKTQFDNLSGGKLTKYLQAVRRAVETEVVREPAEIDAPDRLARISFRVLLAVFARRDRESRGSRSIEKRLGRVVSGWRFVNNRGRVPRVNPYLGETTFDAVEQPRGFVPEIETTLERYYSVKLNSMQFFGPANFDRSVLDGLQSLVLTLPMVLWLSRAFQDVPPLKSVELALEIVDDHFGGDPMLRLPHLRYLQDTLIQRGDVEKLLAWYSR